MEIISSSVFDDWLGSLRDKHAQRRILYAIFRCEAHGRMLGDIKPVGGLVSELRFHFGAGYRVYFTQIGEITVVLLAGGDKSTQAKDIERAKVIARKIREEQA